MQPADCDSYIQRIGHELLSGCMCTGHEVQFLESQQNLKNSNLVEVSIEDSNKIFKGPPSPETGQSD